MLYVERLHVDVLGVRLSDGCRTPRHSKLSPLGSGDDHIHLPAAAPGTDKPVAPNENGRVRAISSSHLGRVRLDLVAARLAPHDQPHLRVRRIAKRHRRAG
jgi:hypothetical protein